MYENEACYNFENHIDQTRFCFGWEGFTYKAVPSNSFKITIMQRDVHQTTEEECRKIIFFLEIVKVNILLSPPELLEVHIWYISDYERFTLIHFNWSLQLTRHSSAQRRKTTTKRETLHTFKHSKIATYET